ncbi:MAG: DUF3500 domain-containing protein [Bryobacteraceae bacterium]
MSQAKWRMLAAGTAIVLLTAAHYRTNTIGIMSEAAQAFLASLTPEQRAKVAFRFEDDERLFWHFIPTDDIPNRYKKPRMGLILADMSSHQKHLASALLSAGLSQRGFIKATTVMSLEDVLRILEKDTRGRRNPEKYHFSIFGDPTGDGVWSYRIEGHHLSLHFTVVKGKVAASPTFFGANPAEVRDGPRKGLRALAKEEDLGRDLLMALDPAQRKVAIVAGKAYNDILTAADRKAALQGQPNGLTASKMNARQRRLLHAVMEEYVHNVPEPLAQARLTQIKKAGANLFFAWAGVAGKGGPHYYRVQAPSFLIEYDNTQNDANHIHSVWRDYEGDFGLDLLKLHYDSSHK